MLYWYTGAHSIERPLLYWYTGSPFDRGTSVLPVNRCPFDRGTYVVSVNRCPFDSRVDLLIEGLVDGSKPECLCFIGVNCAAWCCCAGLCSISPQREHADDHRADDGHDVHGARRPCR